MNRPVVRLGFCVVFAAAAASAAPLELERKIPLGAVNGRIDHFAIDCARQHLFLAELGNDTVGVIDLATGSVARRLAGFREPQGLGFDPKTDALIVANGGDGAVTFFAGADLSAVAAVDLGSDADNVRIPPNTADIVVGFGDGALAIVDAASRKTRTEIPLKGHPEGFQIDPARGRAYVNVPDAREIAVIDLASARQSASWTKLPAGANFPMALLDDGARVVVAFRRPARLIIFDAPSGAIAADVPTCGDADDVFVDRKRDRLYVACGEGKIDVFTTARGAAERQAQIETVAGARTAFFDAEADRYYLAVRAGLASAAAVWVYRPN